MSKMCSLNGDCKSHKGMCKHEKMIMGMFLVVGLGILYLAFA